MSEVTPQVGPSSPTARSFESKEALGGYYLIDAPDLDEAIKLAKLVPEATAPFSGVEIRPVREPGA